MCPSSPVFNSTRKMYVTSPPTCWTLRPDETVQQQGRDRKAQQLPGETRVARGGHIRKQKRCINPLLENEQATRRRYGVQ